MLNQFTHIFAHIQHIINIYQLDSRNQNCYANSTGDCVQVPNSCVISGQVLIDNICVCPNGYSVVENECKQSIYESKFDVVLHNSDAVNLKCVVEIFIGQYNLFSITRNITSTLEFNNGYVFSAAQNVQDSFINIADNIYDSGLPSLFQQMSFSNIKIQIGLVNDWTSGAFLVSYINTNSTINQLYILSTPGTVIQISTNHQITVITNQIAENKMDIIKLKIDLNIVKSQGNIILIWAIQNVKLQLTYYKVSGIYHSNGRVAMLAAVIQNSNINIQYLNFQPRHFYCGNQSTYLIYQSLSNQITFVNMLINVNNKLRLDYIETDTDNFYQFGGLINTVEVSNIVIVNSIVNIDQTFCTKYINQTGILIGTTDIQGSIFVEYLCIDISISGNNQFSQSGLFGIIHNHKLQLYLTSINYYVKANSLNQYGICGYCQFYSISQITISANLIAMIQKSSSVGIIIGYSFQTTSSINQITETKILNSQIQTLQLDVSGLLCGFIQNSQIHIHYILINNSNISQGTALGGLLGAIISSNLLIDYLVIDSVNIIYVSGYSVNNGIVVGYWDNTTFQITNSQLTGENIVNNQQVSTDCPIILSNLQQGGGC
ncbi:Hypothetical_protein [Hexamita inflata]|uniref:Hypothetical_protein n=1 Tax=Hexamita inflata TaxID=28002 RepID=A0AA86UMW9_9EUKA|nr:Hypothetical protein HINF_LOCUS45211 [Hexamita inflata]